MPDELDPPVDSTQDQALPESNDTGTGTGTGINPAWNELLGIMPTQLHPQMIPHLQKWDQGVQQQFQKVHSQYEPYKPFLDAQVDPQQIQYALQIMEHLNNNPRQIYDALAEFHGWNEQGQTEPNAPVTEDYSDLGNIVDEDPRISQLNEQVELMRNIMLAQYNEQQQAQMQQQQSQQEQQEDQALEEEFTTLKSKYGEFDERYVLGLMAAGTSAEDAVKSYNELVEQTLQNRPGNSAPRVLGGGGGVPSNAINHSSLSDEDRRRLVVQRLQQAAQNR